MKTPVHVVWRRPSPEKEPRWMILYASGKTSRIHSKRRDGVIGVALSLGRVVVVHQESGAIDFVLQPEDRARFHALMAVVVVSFLAMIVGVVWGVMWLTRHLF